MFLNQSIIREFSQLKDIFPEVMEASDGSYYLLFTFNEREVCLLKMERAGIDRIGVRVYGTGGNEAISANLLKWFYWIFAK